MKSVIYTERVPIKLWLDNVETGALRQAKNLANLPFIHSHVALMPDCHQGYGMPIGSVIATNNVIIPNAVGVDIGCGMCAVQTSLTTIDTETLKHIIGGSREYKGGIRSSIPLGFNHHSHKQDKNLMPTLDSGLIVDFNYESALKQLGTLGGGNHFIEIQKGSDGFIWIMLHSGSRNLGKQVAEHYNQLAVNYNASWYSGVPKEYQLAFLPLYSNTAKDYIKEMRYCIAFAEASRSLMLDKVKDAFTAAVPEVSFGEVIDVVHNYVMPLQLDSVELVLHRKGAISAKTDELGIIPGSQGSKSYIVKGLGNKDSFCSCSHGAGRSMSRTRAKLDLSLETELNHLHSLRNNKNLDESTGAYKCIDTVMDNQQDLVRTIVELTPLATIKG